MQWRLRLRKVPIQNCPSTIASTGHPDFPGHAVAILSGICPPSAKAQSSRSIAANPWWSSMARTICWTGVRLSSCRRQVLKGRSRQMQKTPAVWTLTSQCLEPTVRICGVCSSHGGDTSVQWIERQRSSARVGWKPGHRRMRTRMLRPRIHGLWRQAKLRGLSWRLRANTPRHWGAAALVWSRHLQRFLSAGWRWGHGSRYAEWR